MSAAPSPEQYAAAVIAALRDAGATIASSESLTGGLFAATLTSVPGASDVVRGGLVVYATDLKATLGAVDPDVLAQFGPVSAQVAGQLAGGVARVAGADWGVSMTGVAGPDRQDGHEVGTVFVAICRRDGDPSVHAHHFAGDRQQIRASTVRSVLELVHATVTRA